MNNRLRKKLIQLSQDKKIKHEVKFLQQLIKTGSIWGIKM